MSKHKSNCGRLNEERIAKWNDPDVENIPVYEPGLRHCKTFRKEFVFSTEVDKAIDEAELILYP
jgi:UDPglucose 6-dehydrogenase